MSQLQEVYIADGTRVPFLKARGKPGPFTPVDLAVQAGRTLIIRNQIPKENIDDVILGCVGVHPDEVNPGRVAALRIGLNATTPAWTVQRNCASGMQSIDTAFQMIRANQAHIILAGGTDALSHSPILFTDKMVKWLAQFNGAKSIKQKLKAIVKFKPAYLAPSFGILRALSDPVVKLNMGQTAEILAHQFQISRTDADKYAIRSHNRLENAHQNGHLEELVPAFDKQGNIYLKDDGVRPNSTLEKLAQLKPAFEKPFGKVTPANASQISDGASWTLIVSKNAIQKFKLKPIAKIIDCNWAACDPAIMGYGPVIASTPLLQRNKLKRKDIGAWEINEAFAAQVLACLKAWEDKNFCQNFLQLENPFGTLDHEILNVDGGAISLGHPVGASGNRITLHLAHVMRRKNAKYGVATECIGGGMGGAMLLENAQ